MQTFAWLTKPSVTRAATARGDPQPELWPPRSSPRAAVSVFRVCVCVLVVLFQNHTDVCSQALSVRAQRPLAAPMSWQLVGPRPSLWLSEAPSCVCATSSRPSV